MTQEDARPFYRKRRWYIAAIVGIVLAYYGVPLVFLKSPVKSHLASKYGIHVDIESVRLSIRGLIVTDVSAVWPELNMTVSTQELTLGISPLKSLARGRPVFERLKIVYPTIAWRIPRGAQAPEAPGLPAISGPDGDASSTSENSRLRLPESFDLTIRRGRIHLMRGDAVADLYPFDAEIERASPGHIDGWISLESRELGKFEAHYTEGESLKVEADAINLAMLSEFLVLNRTHRIGGLLSARVDREGGEAHGGVKIEGLTWSGEPSGEPGTDSQTPVSPAAMTDSGVNAPIETVGNETSAVTETSVAVDSTSEISPSSESIPAEPSPAGTSISTIETAVELVPYIPIPLDVSVDLSKGRWESRALTIDEGRLQVADLSIGASGHVEFSRRLDADLDFYAPAFDEPALESLSRHFHVLRYLHAFLETIRSPSHLQAKMHLTGPLTRPKEWLYDGMIDIGRDTFSYSPFEGQYSFLGTVRFDQRGVTIPEIQMPFGEENLILSGTAADYLAHESRMELKGSGLNIGPPLLYYLPAALRAQDTGAPAPSGMGDVNLVLSKKGDQPWSLDGTTGFKRVALPLKIFAVPVRAYGEMTFSGRRGSGSLRVRTGAFEAELHPYAENLFSTAPIAGVSWKQSNVRWERLAGSFSSDRPVPFVPTSGGGSVTLKLFRETVESVDSPPERKWRMDGTAELSAGRFVLPPFGTPVDSASAALTFESGVIRIQRAAGVLGRSNISAAGQSSPSDPRVWDLTFQSPDLDLPDLLSRIAPGNPSVEPAPFEVRAAASVDKFRFHAFEISGVAGRFSISPHLFTLAIDSPIRATYTSDRRAEPLTELSFAADSAFPLKNLFGPATAMGGDISGTVVLRGPDFSDTSRIRGDMDLRLDQFTIRKAPALLKIVELTRFSFMDALVFDPFEFKSPVQDGAVTIQFDQMSNAGRWIFRGRLGLDASYRPLDESDSAFHVTFYPRENFIARILDESKILSLLGGKGEGVKLDFGLVGNYNSANILWTNAPLFSVIRGRVGEFVPGLFNAPGHADTERPLKKE